jgi:hypothetical protein
MSSCRKTEPTMSKLAEIPKTEKSSATDCFSQIKTAAYYFLLKLVTTNQPLRFSWVKFCSDTP